MQLGYYFILVLGIWLTSCGGIAKPSNNNEILELCNKSFMFTQREIVFGKCPPAPNDDYKSYCPKSFTNFCDTLKIVSNLGEYRYAIGEVVNDEDKRIKLIADMPDSFYLKAEQITTYNEPEIINKRVNYKIKDIGTCIIQIDYPFIIHNDAWVGIHWISKENYSEYLLKFRKNKNDGAWRFVSLSPGGYS